MIRASRALTLIILLGGAALPGMAQQEEHEGADFQLRRQAWFDDRRAFPNSQVNWESYVAARRSFASRRNAFASFASASSGSWLPMGPGGFFGLGYWDSGAQVDAGRVDAIALHPTAPGTMLIASPNGGVWRTITNGANWDPVFDSQCTLQMSTLRIDPVNPNIVYAGAAYASGASGCALFRSTDGGSTWTNWNGNLNFTAYNGGFINALYIDPASAGSTTATTLMFTYGGGGIYRSTNSGGSYSRALTFGYVTSIVALPSTPGIVFAGVADYATSPSARSGLYRSADNGASWTQVASGALDFTNAGRLQLATSDAQPGSVWVLAATKGSRYLSLSRWDEGASQLVALGAAGVDLRDNSRAHFGTQGTYDLALAVDPADAKRVYIAGVRAFRSVDGGAQFRPMATEIHCDWHDLVADPRNRGRLYAGTDGGVFTSSDGGDSWTSLNNGLVISMFYPGIAQHPTDASVVLGGLQDNGSLMSNGTPLFGAVTGGDGGYAAINPRAPFTIYTTCQWSRSGGACIYRRSPTSFTFRTSGIVAADRAQFIPPLVMDPATPTTLYFGTMRLYRTTNEGALWSPVSVDLTQGTGSITAIAVAPTDALTIYVGTSDGNVQVTRDGGTTFTISTAGLPTRSITRFAVDPLDAKRALVTLSGSGAAHVFITADAGLTWTNVTGNLPDMPVSAAVMVDDGPNHFFVATDVGVFESTDAGLTWSNTPSGMPAVVVHDLSYNPVTKQLVAATFGRGLYRYSLANPAAVLRGDVNRDGVVNAFDALLIQQGLVGQQLPTGLTSLPHGDADCNGRLEAADALIVLRYAVGLPTPGACVGTNR